MYVILALSLKSKLKDGIVMTQINDNVLKVLKEKNIPVTSQEIEDGHYLHRMSFQVQKSKQLVVEMIIQNT